MQIVRHGDHRRAVRDALVILIVSGPVAESVGNAIGVGDDLVMIWDWAKWPVLALVVMVIVALLYYATPNVDFTRFRVISVGAFVAILVWLVASIGFAFYVANFGSYNKTYGSVAGVVSRCSGCGSPTWRCCSVPSSTPSSSVDASCSSASPPRRPCSCRCATPAGSRRRPPGEAKDVERMREIRLASTTPGDPADRPFARS